MLDGIKSAAIQSKSNPMHTGACEMFSSLSHIVLQTFAIVVWDCFSIYMRVLMKVGIKVFLRPLPVDGVPYLMIRIVY